MTDPLRSEKDLHVVQVSLQELEEVLMRIVGGLDIHRQRVTFDWVDLDSGEAERGRITPADRVGFREWLGQFDGEVEVVLEGCTGWRFIAEECAAPGRRCMSRIPPRSRDGVVRSGQRRPTRSTP
jgi:transposase